MSGPLGTGSGGGAGTITSVTGGTGISVSGSTSLTVTNTGVTSLAGTGVSVSAATGAVTITAPVVAGDTGISVSGSQTTSLSISNTGVTSLVAGSGITVSGATGAVTVTATGSAGATLGPIGVPTTDGMQIGIKSGAGGAMAIQSAGAAVGSRATINFSSGMTVTDSAGSARVDIAPSFGTPVAVTGGATAASGSATTLARSDHVHSTASMPVLLASTTLGSDAASYTFSSISGTYTNLGIRLYLRTSYAGATDYLGIRYNGDTAANYSWHQSTGQTSILIGSVNAANNGIANAASYGEVFIPHYSVTTFGHSTGALLYYNGSSTATPSFSSNLSSGSGANTGGYWNSTSAITSVTILSVLGANLKANSRFDLYGYP